MTGIWRVARAAQPAERAHVARRRRAALGARVQVVALLDRVAGEALLAALEEVEHERRLGARRAFLDLVEELLVAEVAVARGHRALLDDVVDAGEHAVGRELALAEPHERLHLAHEAGCCGQHRMLAAEVLDLPAQHVAEQHRRFVVEVVAGREHVVAVRERGVVEDVALRQAARRARGALGSPAIRSGRRSRTSSRRSTSSELPVARARERARVARRTRRSTRRCRDRRTGRRRRSRARGGAATGRASPCRPTRRRGRDRLGGHHVEVLDRPPHLLAAVPEEAVGAEARVVARHVDDRRLAAPPALHAAPPDMTGRISTTSSSCRRSSWVASVSLRITSTDSGTMSRSRRSCATLCGAGTSSSRRGLRKSDLSWCGAQGTGGGRRSPPVMLPGPS